jgi:excisionase family DNA binding protein
MGTTTKKEQIIGLKHMRLKNSDIASLLKVSRQYVSYISRNFDDGLKSHTETSGNKEFITTGDASRLLGVSEATIRRWADEGKIPSFRINIGRRDRRISVRDLEQIIIRTAEGFNKDL